MRRILHVLVLLLAFLFAQVGLVAHAASHLVPVSHVGEDGIQAEAACELCVGYAQFGGGAPPVALPLLPHSEARHEVPSCVAPVLVTRSAFFLYARAPPVFPEHCC